MTNFVSNLLIDGAKETFRVYTNNERLHNKIKKDWYTSDYHKAKKKYNKSQKLYKNYGSNLFKGRLRRSERYYKKVLILVYKSIIKN